MADGVDALEIAARAGVKIGYGTDLPGATHDAQSAEFGLRAAVQAPIDMLRAATSIHAELLGRAGELGVLAPGAAVERLSALR